MTFVEKINIGVTFSVIIVNIVVGFLLNRKMEGIKLKNSKELTGFGSELSLLNRKSEIKFQKFHLEQADALKHLYSHLIDLRYKTHSVFSNSYNSSPHVEYKSKLINWIKQYSAYSKYYYMNRILFSQEINKLVNIHLGYFKNMYKIIHGNINDLEETEMIFQNQLEYAYETSEAELTEINSKLEKLKSDMKNGVEDFKFDDLAKVCQLKE